MIAIDYYIDSYVTILRNNGFKNWYYVDPFSGSGLLKLGEGDLFPGSPLIPLFKEDKYKFSEYFLSDRNPKYVRVLKQRTNKVLSTKKHKHEFKLSVDQKDCNSAICDIFTGVKPSNWKEYSYLVLLDSFGWDVKWESMEKILKSGPIDIIFTFMTWSINWNKDIPQSKKKLNEFFGDSEWENNKEDLLGYYRSKIEKYGYDRKYKTYEIAVENDQGKSYHLILTSQSQGAAKVFQSLKERVDEVTTECLTSAFRVVVGKQSDMTQFFR